jgi:SAM-dependent methyltransferase
VTKVFDSGRYWEERYRSGRNSGAGSYGRLAKFKAAFLNDFYKSQGIASHIDFGVGDGNQLSLLTPAFYTGVDVAPTVIERARERFAEFKNYRFLLASELEGVDRCDLSSSIDVIYHLIEDQVFEAYMRRLFLFARRFVIIYSSNIEGRPGAVHVRHRRFTDFVEANLPEWRLVKHVPNRYPYDPARRNDRSCADFFVFAARGEELRP